MVMEVVSGYGYVTTAMVVNVMLNIWLNTQVGKLFDMGLTHSAQNR